jgi:hypothetical protein
MPSFTIIKSLKQTYHIQGYEGYSFCDNKKLYNLKTGREIKQTINGGSYGYWIKGKYFTLKKLKPLLKRPENFECPF